MTPTGVGVAGDRSRRPSGVGPGRRCGGRPAAAGVRRSSSAAGGGCPPRSSGPAPGTRSSPARSSSATRGSSRASPSAGEVGRVLGLRHHPDRLAPDRPRTCRARSRISASVGIGVLPVVRGAGRAELRQPFPGPQRPQLGQGEVLGEPAGDVDPVDGLGRLAVGDLGLGGHVGRTADLVLVPGDQHPVGGAHHIGLDRVGTLLGWPARTRPGCARGGSRWRRGGRSRSAGAASLLTFSQEVVTEWCVGFGGQEATWSSPSSSNRSAARPTILGSGAPTTSMSLPS